jgi:hypothetical protein
LIDPFSEWMKIRGWWASILSYRSGDDFKFFALEPSDIAVSGLERIRAEIQAMNLGRGVRLDIQATLHCVQALIKLSDAFQDEPDPIPLLGKSPRAVISGLRQAYFKSLGTAAALMNDAFLPLPDWFAIRTTADATVYLSVIDEAVARPGGCLNSLQENNSDDGETLQRYREWLTAGELLDLLDFHQRFALHLMQRLSRREWARPFNTVNLTALLSRAYEGKHHVTEIIEDPGFRSVARALRNSTVYALTIDNLKREVRFGIAQRWKQKLKAGNEEFAAEVAEFVQDYNWETARKLEGKGHSVTTEELDSVLHLIQTRTAALVGPLLLAYGYARAPKVEQSPSEAPAVEP